MTTEHPDNAVTEAEDVREVPSPAIAEAQLRHEQAELPTATYQEKRQAAVEQAHALESRPDGSYAQLHETDPAQVQPSVAVADERAKSEGREAVEAARDELSGAAPAGSPAGIEADEKAAQDRTEAEKAGNPDNSRTETATRSTADAETRPDAKTAAAKTTSTNKAAGR